jgi:hypothetical protein
MKRESFEDEAFLQQSRISEDEALFPSEKKSTRRGVLWYLRILLEIGMAATIVFLLFLRPTTTTEHIRKTPVPNCMFVLQNY